jgi:hypothetical protein
MQRQAHSMIAPLDGASPAPAPPPRALANATIPPSRCRSPR